MGLVQFCARASQVCSFPIPGSRASECAVSTVTFLCDSMIGLTIATIEDRVHAAVNLATVHARLRVWAQGPALAR